MPETTIAIRALVETDSIAALTDLHRAYKPLLDMGLRYLATHQSVEVTGNRINGGLCLLALIDERVVGTVTYHRRSSWDGSPWMLRPDVANWGQFAVEP